MTSQTTLKDALSLKEPVKILDCRNFESYKSIRLKNSYHIPADRLPFRTHELPDKHKLLYVIGQDQVQVEIKKPHNSQSKYQLLTPCKFLSERGWQVIDATAEFSQAASEDQQSCFFASGQPIEMKPLFSPCQFLLNYVEVIEESLAQPGQSNLNEQKLSAQACTGVCCNAIDLGCGSGRDISYLAIRRDKIDWRCCGLDNRRSMIERAGSITEALQIQHQCGCVLGQLTTQGTIKFKDNHQKRVFLKLFSQNESQSLESVSNDDSSSQVKQQTIQAKASTSQHFSADIAPNDLEININQYKQLQFDLLLMVRFLNREVIKHADQWLRVGGYILVYTFTEGAENMGGPSKDKDILKASELKDLISQSGNLKIVAQELQNLADNRPMLGVLA